MGEAMRVYLQLTVLALLPVLCSACFYQAERKTAFGRLPYGVKQALYGLVFGLVAVCNTEFGVPIDGAVVNVRDAAPLCAGLLFGAPAGILAGFIGGVERYFAVFWGAGAYTQLACSIATVLAGLFGSILRKFVFENKKPTWYYGLAVGLIMETLHMLMIFFTNVSDVRTAFGYVQTCTVPMLVSNSLSVMCALLIVSALGKEKHQKPREKRNISQTFQRWLLACILVAFCATGIFTYAMQTKVSESETDSLLSLNLEDVRQDISDASDENLLSITREVAALLEREPNADNARLAEIAEDMDVAEINVIDENGVIVKGTNPSFWNYDMASGEQSREFLTLLDGAREYVQSYQPTSSDASVWRKYAGVVLSGGGFVQVGYDAAHFQEDIDRQVVGATRNRHVGEGGSLIICNEDQIIVSDRSGGEGLSLSEIGLHADAMSVPEGVRFSAEVHGTPSYCMYVTGEGYRIVAVLPQSEAVFTRNMSVYILVFMEVLIFAALFLLIYVLIKRLIVDNIRKINHSLAKITGGNLNEVVDVRSNAEFASLSDDINSTVTTLKRYIAEASARIDRELEYAKVIQYAALPQVFPPYPDRSELDIYASMDAAKEVGGDFYDFFLLGEDRLAFLIADVSGKGIPAAMFMMTSKTLIKGLAEAGHTPDEILTLANAELCKNNNAGMFVTAWLGILNLKTGALEYANAGHNPPLVRRNGRFEFLKGKGGFVLAGLENTQYKKGKLDLQPGDGIFLYTDGVTEAEDTAEHLYGSERLQALLQANSDDSARVLCEKVRADVDAFAGGAPQFDDITTLYLRFLKQKEDGHAGTNTGCNDRKY